MKPSLVLRILPLALAASTAGTAHAADCDRDCLRGFITQYLEAMVAHNPGALPLAAKARFTEDTVEMRLGDGLWKNASKIRSYRQDILDVRQGVAASQVIVEEAGSPVMLVLRMKVVDKKISEVETQVTRTQKEGAIFNIKALETPNKAMAVVPDRGQLASREAAIKIAELYPAGLKIGSFRTVGTPCLSSGERNHHSGSGMLARRLREHEDPDHHEASGRHVARGRGGRGVGHLPAAHEFRRHGIVRSRGCADRVGGLQDLRRRDPRGGGVHAGNAGERGVGLG